MTKEKFNQATKLWGEIDRLDLLIKQIESGVINDRVFSDYGYLIHLVGENNVLGIMRDRISDLVKEFEAL